MSIKHGFARRGQKTKEYRCWQSILTRCHNERAINYDWYGGRGIAVCNRWATSFESFLEDMGQCPPGHSIDRFPDKNGNYEPAKCRWASPRQQGANTRRCVLVEYHGQTMHISEAARRGGVVSETVAANRIKRGWPVEEAVERGLLPSSGSRYRRREHA